MKILVVEDELALQKALKTGLTKKGCLVDTADDGKEALDLFFENIYDLVVLDLNLPYYDGLDVLNEIRKEDKEVKVLILSARSEVDHKITGLDLGANDYLAKPFYFTELEARIRALLRRNFVVSSKIIEIDNIVVDTTERIVKVDDEIIELTNKEYGIFEYLLLNRRRIISLGEIIDHVWESDNNNYSNSVKVHLNNLKKKIGEDIIKNKRGEGYYVE